MKQPFDAITRIGQWCEANGIEWAVAGSWALMLQGVVLPSAPHDLDVPIGLEDLTEFYQDNPWLRQRAGESVGRSLITEDLYTVDILPTVNDFQRGTLARAKPISWGGITVRLTDPIDIMLYKLGHEFWDDRGEATCCAIVKWKYDRKPNRPGDRLDLSGGDQGKYWAGPHHVFKRDI